MRYELLKYTLSEETDVYDVVNHPNGEVTETLTDKHCVAIYLELKDTETGLVHLEQIIVESHNNDSDEDIEKKRQSAIDKFISKINNSDFTPSENSQRASVPIVNDDIIEKLKKDVACEYGEPDDVFRIIKDEAPKKSNKKLIIEILLITAGSVGLIALGYWLFNN